MSKRTTDKYRPPVFSHIQPRRRLLERMAELAHIHAALWISAPAGSGKSALVSDYLQRNKVEVFWFRIESADCDAKHFLYRLQQAVRELTGNKPEPQLEYDDPAEHINAALQSLKQYCAGRVVMVWDNCEFLPADSAQMECLANQIDQETTSLRQLFLSRETLPAQFSRAMVSGSIAQLAWDDLRLDKDEFRDMATFLNGGGVEENTLNQWYEMSQGWLAALILIVRGHHIKSTAIQDTTRETLFDYLASEVVAGLSSDERELLLNLSLYPYLSESLVAAHCDAAMLHQLAKFLPMIDRDGASVYRMHALLRDFLRQQLRQQSTDEAYRDRVMLVADRLLKAHENEAAGELYYSISRWSELHRMVVIHAENLLASGAQQSLEKWLDALPDEYRQKDPWVIYWQGNCRRFVDWHNSWPMLQQAFERFREKGDVLGQYSAWLALAEAMMAVHEDIKPLKQWAKEYEALRERHPRCPSMAMHFKSHGLASAIMSMVDPHNPKLKRFIRLAEAGARLIPVRGPRQALYIYLILHYVNTGQVARMHAVARHVVSALDNRDLPAPMRIFGHAMIGLHKLMAGESAPEKYIEAAFELSRHTGGGVYTMVPATFRIYCDLIEGRQKEVRHAVEEMAKVMLPNHRMYQSAYDFVNAWWAASEGEYGRSVEIAGLSKRMSYQLGFDFGMSLNANLRLQVLVMLDDFDAATSELAELKRLNEESDNRLLDVMQGYSESWLKLKSGDEAGCVAILHEVLPRAEREGVYAWPGFLREVVATLALVASRHGVAPNYVSRLIRRWHLQPPLLSPLDIDWPWAVRILTFGRLTVIIAGEELDTDSAAHRRPLELLMAILAQGGREVTKAQLSDWLWPETEADKASHALDNLLHRLRKLLGKESLLINAGRITLNPDICWVDLWALEKLRETVNEIEPQTLNTLLGEIYSGSFISGDSQPWLIAARDHYRTLYIRLVDRLATQLFAAGENEDAVDLLEQALQREVTAEALYLQLIRFHIAMDQRSEAMQRYRQCANFLQQSLGVQPGEAIESLIRTMNG